MSNSKLVTYKNPSPNNSGKRQQKIDRISPHCVVAQWTAEQIGVWFSYSSTKASSNYGIGRDGEIGLYVDESKRSWCTSSKANDQRAVTIECASDSFAPYTMNNAVYESLVKLCADICKRNGKKKLLWIANRETALNYVPKSDEMLITVHRWFANKSCPGDWLYNRLDDLANRVNAILGSRDVISEPEVSSVTLLKIGSEGQAVKELQTKLNKLGAKLAVDGDFGVNTRAAVVAFQKKYELDTDGIAGPLTLAKLDEVLTSGTKQTTEETKQDSFMVRVTMPNLNIRTGPGVSNSIVGICPSGAFTIVQTAQVDGQEWGKLKSGIGWICLKYVTIL